MAEVTVFNKGLNYYVTTRKDLESKLRWEEIGVMDP